MRQQFEEIELHAERVPAISSEDIEAIRANWKIFPEHMSMAEVACTLSHVKAWESLLMSGAPAALILEDDAVLSPDLSRLLSWELYERYFPSIIKFETFRKTIRMGSSKLISKKYSMGRLLSNHEGTAAYIIERNYAKKCIELSKINIDIADTFLFQNSQSKIKNTKIFQLTPAPCIQVTRLSHFGETSLIESDIATARDNRRAAGVGKSVFIPGRSTNPWNRRISLLQYYFLDPLAAFYPKIEVPFSEDTENQAPST
ncbi:glycosyltransferase family 25 protein [Devosia honganensis]